MSRMFWDRVRGRFNREMTQEKRNFDILLEVAVLKSAAYLTYGNYEEAKKQILYLYEKRLKDLTGTAN